jgi:hypothetical protein
MLPVAGAMSFVITDDDGRELDYDDLVDLLPENDN